MQAKPLACDAACASASRTLSPALRLFSCGCTTCTQPFRREETIRHEEGWADTENHSNRAFSEPTGTCLINASPVVDVVERRVSLVDLRRNSC